MQTSVNISFKLNIIKLKLKTIQYAPETVSSSLPSVLSVLYLINYGILNYYKKGRFHNWEI